MRCLFGGARTAGLATAGLCFAAWAMMGLGMGVAACSVAATGAAAGMAAGWGAVARAVPSVEPGELSTSSPVDDCLSGPTDSGWSCLGLRFIVFNFWQLRLPGETTRKPRLPGRHWSVALAFPGSSSACRVREPTVGARGPVEEGFPARLGSLPIALRNPF